MFGIICEITSSYTAPDLLAGILLEVKASNLTQSEYDRIILIIALVFLLCAFWYHRLTNLSRSNTV